MPSREQAQSSNPISGWLLGVKQDVEKKITRHHDDAIEATAHKVLTLVGPELYRAVEDPYLPQPLKGWAAVGFQTASAQIQDELRADVVRAFAWDDLHYVARHNRLKQWPEQPSLFKCCDSRYTWCGALVRFFRVLREQHLGQP